MTFRNTNIYDWNAKCVINYLRLISFNVLRHLWFIIFISRNVLLSLLSLSKIWIETLTILLSKKYHQQRRILVFYSLENTNQNIKCQTPEFSKILRLLSGVWEKRNTHSCRVLSSNQNTADMIKELNLKEPVAGNFFYTHS